MQDRKLAAEVRSLTLKKIKAILEGEENDFQRQVMLKLAATVLPRINEVTGEDGGAVKLVIDKINYIVPDGTDTTPNTETAPSVPSAE